MRRSESARFRFRPPSGDAAPRNDTLRILIVLSDDDSLKSESIADMLPGIVRECRIDIRAVYYKINIYLHRLKFHDTVGTDVGCSRHSRNQKRPEEHDTHKHVSGLVSIISCFRQGGAW